MLFGPDSTHGFVANAAEVRLTCDLTQITRTTSMSAMFGFVVLGWVPGLLQGCSMRLNQSSFVVCDFLLKRSIDRSKNSRMLICVTARTVSSSAAGLVFQCPIVEQLFTCFSLKRIILFSRNLQSFQPSLAAVENLSNQKPPKTAF